MWYLAILACRGGCFLEVMEGLMLRWVQMKNGSIPGASQASHANTSIFFLRNLTNSSFSRGGSYAPTWKNFSKVSPTTTFSKSSHFASSAAVSRGDTGAFNCYKSLLAGTEDSASSRCEMAATTHCLIVDWQPRISRTWSPDGNFTFWCKEEATAPKVWSQGLSTMAVYGE